MPVSEALEEIAAAIGAIAVVGGAVLGMLRLWRRKIMPVLTLADRIAEIHRELTQNGGQSLKDVVSRIEQRQLVAEQREKARDMNSEAGHFETDGGGRWIHANRTLLRWCERGLSEVVGAGWYDTIHGDDVQRVRTAWEDAIELQKEFAQQFRLRAISGRVMYVHASAYPLCNQRGAAIGYWGNVILDAEYSRAMRDAKASER